MRRIGTSLAVLAIAGLGLGLTACSQGGGGGSAAATPSPPTNGIVEYDVNLDGFAVTPGPGVTVGAGTVNITVDPTGKEVCYTLKVSNIGAVTSTYIHEGLPGEAGPVVLALKDAVRQPAKCVNTPASVIQGLTSGDGAFYVDANTADYPDGALRAQLKG